MPRSGLLNIAKPHGRTSRWVVDQVQRLVRPDKAGHAGTLDPLATGVLVVCVGQATRLIEYIQRMPKRYTGTFLLGRSSPTEDIDGDVAILADAPTPSFSEVVAAALKFVGPVVQQPPVYSALKVAGRRAYEMARQGHSLELAPRNVVVHSIEIERYDYPELVLRIECGSGTYVRSLGRDLARELGTEAVMSALVRTAIGPFRLDDAVEPGRLDREMLAASLLPPAIAVASLPCVALTAAEAGRIAHGLSIECHGGVAAPQIAAFEPTGRLLAILERLPDGRLGPVRVFVADG
jgi:tRNA pseudouridine55 synthase